MNRKNFTPLLKGLSASDITVNISKLFDTEDINELSYDKKTFPYLYSIQYSGGLDSRFRDNPKLDVNNRNKYNETALIFLAKEGNFQDIQVLLERGADYTVIDRYGKTALEYLAEYCDKVDEYYLKYDKIKEWIDNNPIKK